MNGKRHLQDLLQSKELILDYDKQEMLLLNGKNFIVRTDSYLIVPLKLVYQKL